MNRETHINKARNALRLFKKLPEFEQGRIVGKIEEMIDAERRKQESDKTSPT